MNKGVKWGLGCFGLFVGCFVLLVVSLLGFGLLRGPEPQQQRSERDSTRSRLKTPEEFAKAAEEHKQKQAARRIEQERAIAEMDQFLTVTKALLG